MKTHSGLKRRMKVAGALGERSFWHYPVNK
jgi:ribosomal protein L35